MTLPTYDEAFAKAREGAPFSNADEGYPWLETWCGRCTHDREARTSEGPGCPLVMVALMGRTPAEWLDNTETGPDGLLKPYSRSGQYTCVMFRPEDDPGPDEPKPIPDPPGQLTLVPREEFERPARMYADTKPVEVDA
jgi:hypothetical protein